MVSDQEQIVQKVVELKVREVGLTTVEVYHDPSLSPRLFLSSSQICWKTFRVCWRNVVGCSEYFICFVIFINYFVNYE